MKKIFILDTNVLLHDPQALCRFEENDVIVPLIVLEELGKLKNRFDYHGDNAREVMRYINSLEGNLLKGVQVKEGPTIRIAFTKEGKQNDFPFLLDRSSHKILHLAHLLQKKENNVIFVSKNAVNRMKAEVLAIKAQDYESLKVSYETIHRGLKTFLLPKRDIDLFYKDGEITIEDASFTPNEYCLLKSKERSSAVAKYSEKEKKLKPLTAIPEDIWGILPLNVEQKCSMDLLLQDDISLVTLLGPAGTGKTLLTVACSMRKVFDEGVYSKILIARPIVPLGKDIGYLPGTKEEKLYHWMRPIYDNLEFLCQKIEGKESALEFILESKKIEMESVTYIRGRSLSNTYMIIDEAQNLTPHEVKTIISRAGKGTKVILTGDPTQIDNPYLDKDSNGLSYVLSKFQEQSLFGYIFLEKTERSKLAAIAAEVL